MSNEKFNEKFGLTQDEMNTITGGATAPATPGNGETAGNLSCFFSCQTCSPGCSGSCSSCDPSCNACDTSCSGCKYISLIAWEQGSIAANNNHDTPAR